MVWAVYYRGGEGDKVKDIVSVCSMQAAINSTKSNHRKQMFSSVSNSNCQAGKLA